ncbi:MAG: MFS transporter [Acidimicrobiia bacterium]|nr:MFS transporter [Acidimicrobiia bacterium]
MRREDSPSLIPYFAVVALASASLGGVVAVLGQLRDEFGFTDTGIGLIVAAGFAAAFFTFVYLGPLADRGHAVAMIRLGFVTSILGLAAAGLGDQLWHFVVGRVLLGTGLGLIGIAVRRAVIVADPDNVGVNLGRFGAADIGGFMVGPMIAALFSQIAGIDGVFFGFAILYLLLFSTLGTIEVDQADKDDRRRSPRDLLANRGVIGAMMLTAAYFVFIGAFESVFVLQLTDRGASNFTVALALTLVAMPIAVLAPLGGRMAQNIGARRAALWSLAVVTVVIVPYGIVPGVVALIVLSAVGGSVEGLSFPAVPMVMAEALPQHRQAAGQSLVGATEVGVAAVSSLLAAAAYDAWGARAAWWSVAATVGLLVVVAALILRTAPVAPRPSTPAEPVARTAE